MPPKSKDQRQAAGAAYAAKCKGEKKTPKKGASKKMAKNMSCSQLKDYAKKKKG